MMMEKYGLISKFYSSVAEDVSENDELIVKHLDIEKKEMAELSHTVIRHKLQVTSVFHLICYILLKL